MRTWLLVFVAACTSSSERGPRPEDAPGVQPYETDCQETTCGATVKKYVFCTDVNDTTHYHYAGKSCECEHNTKCGECDPYGPCICANDVDAWCRQP